MVNTSLKSALMAFSALFAFAFFKGQDLAYQVAMALFFVSAMGWLGYLLSEPQQKQNQADHYLDGVVKAGVIATIFWGVVGFLAGVYIAFQLAFPALNFDLFWTPSPASYLCCDFCLWRECAYRFIILYCSAHISCALMGRKFGVVCLLGLSAFYRAGGDRLFAGGYAIQRICRARMVFRYLADNCVGCLFGCVFWHNYQTA